jgi:dolichol-phosphate mannosyltransferase
VPAVRERLAGLPFGRLLRFGLVGASGVVVNQGLLMLLHGRLGWPLMPSSALAIECSILSNFALNSTWTWRFDFAGSLRTWLAKAFQYHAATAASAFCGNILVLAALVYLFAVDYRLANLVGIGVGSALNFLASELWVFAGRPR